MTWKTVKLGDLCQVITKGTTPTSIGYKFESNGINFVKIESLNKDGGFIMSKFAYINDKCHSSLKRSQLQEGDILFSIAGALGRAAIVTKDILPANTNQALAILRLKDEVKINKKFLLYTLNSDTIKKQSETFKGGVAQQNLSLTQLKLYNINLPPLAEQQRIIAKLGTAFAEIDKKNKNTNQNIKNAEMLKVKFISKQIEELDKSNLKRLSSICDLTRGPFGGSLTKSMFVKRGFAIYEQKHAIRNNFESIKYFINEEKFNEMKRFELRTGDLLMSCSGTLGKIAIVPENIKRGIINQALLKLTPNKSIISKEFLKLLLSSDYFQKTLWGLSEGAAQVNVPSVKILKNILIPVPDIKKQKEILKKTYLLDNLKLKNLYIQKKELLKFLKSSFLNSFLDLKNKAA